MILKSSCTVCHYSFYLKLIVCDLQNPESRMLHDFTRRTIFRYQSLRGMSYIALNCHFDINWFWSNLLVTSTPLRIIVLGVGLIIEIYFKKHFITIFKEESIRY